MKMSDDDIDYSDISALDFDELGEPVVGRFYRPRKKQISIRLDEDILSWFQSEFPKYQTEINKACRVYMRLKQQKDKK
jgi:uncharacterized protein (DUF4415 family)